MSDKQLDRELLSFLRSWIKWVENGAPYSSPYSRHSGLCDNAKRHTHLLVRHMRCIWHNQGLSDSFPFGRQAYYEADHFGLMHRDEQRLQWVRKTITDLEKLYD